MNRLSKVNDVSVNEKSAGYGRIALKTVYFLLFTVAGLLVYLAMNQMLFANQPAVINYSHRGFSVSASSMQIGFFIGVGVIAVITQIVSAFARKAVPVVGAIFAFCEGYLISFVVFTVIKGYEYLGILALAITIVDVLVMAILYATRVIKLGKKFQMILFTLFAAMIGISLFSFIGYLIPLTRPFVAQLFGNFWLSIGFTVLSIIIATMFLMSDFAMIENVVENKMPAEYEWMAAYGLAFTVLWIYIKILDLLIQILSNRSVNNR